MASAPRPGVGKRAEQSNVAQQLMVITIKGEVRRLAWQNLPIRERIEVRSQTGLSYGALIDPLELESLAVFWWLARRAEGEVGLMFDQVVEDFPNPLDASEFELSFVAPNDGASDPEA